MINIKKLFLNYITSFPLLFRHTQIFCDNRPFPYPADPVIIRTVNRRSSSVLCNIRVCWRLSAPWGILVPSKNRCAWHGVILIRLLKHYKCLWRSFRKLEENFLIYSDLSAHSWTFWKRWSVNKNIFKKSNACRKPKL